jgi:putative sterol carrier protein
MGTLFGTDEWIKALKEELNNSPGYKNAAAKWEGDFYFVITAGDQIAQDIYLYMDLWHGECRDAFKADDPAVKSPEFKLHAPIKIWRGVLEKKIDPIKGIVTKQLKLDGPMMKVMKAPKAAIELVEACTRLNTDWPA